jgi:hypothetical protein
VYGTQCSLQCSQVSAHGSCSVSYEDNPQNHTIYNLDFLILSYHFTKVFSSRLQCLHGPSPLPPPLTHACYMRRASYIQVFSFNGPVILVEKYKLLSSSLCDFLHSITAPSYTLYDVSAYDWIHCWAFVNIITELEEPTFECWGGAFDNFCRKSEYIKMFRSINKTQNLVQQLHTTSWKM